MSCASEKLELSWLESLTASVLKRGPLPRHLAVIMDGNRREGRLTGSTLPDAYSAGSDTLSRFLQWSAALGLREVTLYAFSIENFKRSSQEVDTLVDIFLDNVNRMMHKLDEMNRIGQRICFWGDLSLFPVRLQTSAARLATATRNNKEYRVNICIAYTARWELTHAARHIQECSCGKMSVSEKMVDLASYSRAESPPADLLLRTSGEKRLSDFLLFQTSHSLLDFVPVNWPRLSFWHMAAMVFAYQAHESGLKRARAHYSNKYALEGSQCETDEYHDLMDAVSCRDNHMLDSMMSGLIQQKPLPQCETI